MTFGRVDGGRVVVGRVVGGRVLDTDASVDGTVTAVDGTRVDTGAPTKVVDVAPTNVEVVVAPNTVVVLLLLGTTLDVGTTEGGHGSSNHEAAVGDATSSGPHPANGAPVNWYEADTRTWLARTANGQRPTHGEYQFTLNDTLPPAGTDAMVWYQNPVLSSMTPARTLDSANGADACTTS